MAVTRGQAHVERPRPFGLASLLGTAGVDGYDSFNPAQPHVAHGPLDRVAGLAAVPELQGPDALIRVWRDLTVSAWPSTAMPSARSFQARPDELSAAFETGFTLYFRSVETNVPALVPLARRLEDDLCLPAGTVTCEAFASTVGAGAKMHFDPNATFNVQILGRKTWRIAENRAVTYPHTGFAVGDDPDEGLARYAHAPFPVAMPDDAVAFDASPGSVVYIPHGYWHATEARELSFAVLFTVVQENWASLLTRHIATQLRAGEAWREIPIGLRSPDFWDQRGADVSRLLDDLKRRVARMTPGDVIAALGGPSALRYRVRDGVTIEVSSTGDPDNQTWTLVLSHDGKRAAREIPAALAAVCGWIASCGGAFTGQALVRSLDAVDPEFVVRTLSELHARGVLQVVRRHADASDG